MGLSSLPVRQRPVAALGERPFQGVCSLVAFAVFVPLVWTFFAHKHMGRWLWIVTRGAALRWTLYVGMGACLRPPGREPRPPEPRGGGAR